MTDVSACLYGLTLLCCLRLRRNPSGFSHQYKHRLSHPLDLEQLLRGPGQPRATQQAAELSTLPSHTGRSDDTWRLNAIKKKLTTNPPTRKRPHFHFHERAPASRNQIYICPRRVSEGQLANTSHAPRDSPGQSQHRHPKALFQNSPMLDNADFVSTIEQTPPCDKIKCALRNLQRPRMYAYQGRLPLQGGNSSEDYCIRKANQKRRRHLPWQDGVPIWPAIP